MSAEVQEETGQEQSKQLKPNREYYERILNTLKQATRPLNIKEVHRLTGINYQTCRYVLIELLASGRVSRFTSAHALFYQVKRVG